MNDNDGAHNQKGPGPQSTAPTTTSSFAESLQQAKSSAKGGPDSWNPPFCGDIDMSIKRDGTWFYLGTPIGRPELVKLFASVLRREENAYFLVTPVEKVGITVEDVPFIATALTVEETDMGPGLKFTTNVGDTVMVDADHPIEVWIDEDTQEPAPYVHIRKDLWALITRSIFYDLVEMADQVEHETGEVLMVESAGQFFELGHI